MQPKDAEEHIEPQGGSESTNYRPNYAIRTDPIGGSESTKIASY